jgi:hypothetical protein
MRLPIAILLVAAVAMPSVVQAKSDTPSEALQPAQFKRLLACQGLTDPALRVACYDAEVGALAKAVESHDIVVADKDEVRKTQRSLFGFTLPSVRMLGIGGDSDVKRIETTVQGVRATGEGWQLVLADSGTWTQTDMRSLAMSPKVGNKAVIAKGMLGSYTISIDGQPALKFRRVQ